MSALVVPIGAIDVGEIARIVLLTCLRQFFNFQVSSHPQGRRSSFRRRGKKDKKEAIFLDGSMFYASVLFLYH